jgi:hypothetical protein
VLTATAVPHYKTTAPQAQNNQKTENTDNLALQRQKTTSRRRRDKTTRQQPLNSFSNPRLATHSPSVLVDNRHEVGAGWPVSGVELIHALGEEVAEHGPTHHIHDT